MSFTRRAIVGWGTVVSQKVAFSTTDEQVEVSTDGLKKVVILGLVPLAAAGANDVLAIAETSDADGVIDVPAAGTLTLDRPASGTSGLAVQVTMVGV